MKNVRYVGCNLQLRGETALLRVVDGQAFVQVTGKKRVGRKAIPMCVVDGVDMCYGWHPVDPTDWQETLVSRDGTRKLG